MGLHYHDSSNNDIETQNNRLKSVYAIIGAHILYLVWVEDAILFLQAFYLPTSSAGTNKHIQAASFTVLSKLPYTYLELNMQATSSVNQLTVELQH
jgi:hypothetical protein